jgi:hypothetical protein
VSSESSQTSRPTSQAAEKPLEAVILSEDSRRPLSVMSEAGCSRVSGRVFHALQGHKIVAGGNAPGIRDVRSPTLKGSYYPAPGTQDRPDAIRIRPFQGRSFSEAHFLRGRCPRLLY